MECAKHAVHCTGCVWPWHRVFDSAGAVALGTGCSDDLWGEFLCFVCALRIYKSAQPLHSHPLSHTLSLIYRTHTHIYTHLPVSPQLSDWADGALARRMGCSSVLGSYLDPLGDKALVGCVVGALAAQGALPMWVATLIIGRCVCVFVCCV